jgi:RNA polymerase sigma factor (sigma-70 family)
MVEQDDRQLLEAYAKNGSERAFEALARRHVNLVYSTALRQVGNPSTAAEVTQTVFIILSRKARRLGTGAVLTGWLYRTTQFAAQRALRTEYRRRKREQEAVLMETELTATEPAWEQMAPLLEEGMSHLGEADRNALLLRYFENRSLREVGAALGASEDTAQKRVARAVEKLRAFFTKRGVVLSAVMIPAALSARAVQAAPAGVAAAAVLKGTAVSVSTSAILHETLRVMAWMQVKTGAIVGAGVLLAAAATSFTVREAVQRHEVQYQGRPLSYWLAGYDMQPNGPAWKQADQAVQAVGTNAIPVLLRMYAESDSGVARAGDRQTAVERVSAVSAGAGYAAVPASAALRHHLEASFAFQALGPAASNAVPELVRIFQRNYATLPALHDGTLEGIGGIGPAAREAVPALLEPLAILPEEDRANIFLELGKIHSEPEQVLPVLTAALREPSVMIRRYALFALAQYGAEARPALAAIRELANDPRQDPQISNFASQALKQIDAENAKEQNRGNTP